MRPRRNLTLGSLLFVAAFVGASLALYGGARLVGVAEQATAETDTAEDTGGVPGGPVTIRLVAKDLKFDKRSASASSGASVTAILDNQDAGVLHNLAFYTNNRATQSIKAIDPFAGPGTREFTFAAPTPGSYFYRCDVHPDTMTGTLTVR